MICPKCNEDRLHRSHRRGLWEHLLSWFMKYPYRCQNCGTRIILRPDEMESPNSSSRSSVEMEIKKTWAKAEWKRRRTQMAVYASGLLFFAIFLYFILQEHMGGQGGGSN